jgi:hypothetical protein
LSANSSVSPVNTGAAIYGNGSMITAVGVVSIETVGPSSMLLVNEQAANGQNVPISMSLPLSAGCYDMTVEVFADALPSGTGAGSASASCNVLLSP